MLSASWRLLSKRVKPLSKKSRVSSRCRPARKRDTLSSGRWSMGEMPGGAGMPREADGAADEAVGVWMAEPAPFAAADEAARATASLAVD